MADRKKVTTGTANRGRSKPSDWRYVIILARFFIALLDFGFGKSLGVLLGHMVERYGTDYKTMAFVCSLVTTFMFISSPIVHLLLKRFGARTISVTGGVLASTSLIASSYAPNITVLALCLFMMGFGMSMNLFPILVVMNEMFSDDFVFWTSVAGFGVTAGTFVLPVITERSFAAYGYNGAFLILGGIFLHTVVCGAAIRNEENLAGNRNVDGVNKRRGQEKYSNATLDEVDEQAAGRTRGCDVKDCTRSETRDAQQADLDYGERDRQRCDGAEETEDGAYQQPPEWVTRESAPESLITNHGISTRNGSKSQMTKYFHVNNNVNHPEHGHTSSIPIKEACDRTFSSDDENCAADENCLLVPSLKRREIDSSQLQWSENAEGNDVASLHSYLQSTLLYQEPYLILMLPVVFLVGYVQFAWFLFVVPHAEWLGIPASRAVLLATMSGASGNLGRILFLASTHLGVNVFIFYTVMSAISAVIYFLDPLSSSFWFLSLTTSLQAIPVFSMSALPSVVAKSTIKKDINFSLAVSILYVSASLGFLAGAFWTGHIFDVTGSPAVVFLHLGGLNAVISILFLTHILLTRRYSPSANDVSSS